jgi:chromate transporter
LSTDSPKPSLLDLALGFMNVGLTSVGGALGPLRHVVVKQRGWLSDSELAEYYGVAQTLPGATVVNIAVMMCDRFAGPLGAFAALAGLIIPSLLIAIILSGFATQWAAENPRFAAAEIAVTAAVAGIMISNGIRVFADIWREESQIGMTWRSARIAIGTLGILLVAALHVSVPVAMIIMIVLGMLMDLRLRGLAREGEA